MMALFFNVTQISQSNIILMKTILQKAMAVTSFYCLFQLGDLLKIITFSAQYSTTTFPVLIYYDNMISHFASASTRPPYCTHVMRVMGGEATPTKGLRMLQKLIYSVVHLIRISGEHKLSLIYQTF